MKKLACVALLFSLAGVSHAGRAEPLSFDQAANVTGVHGGIEFGTDFSHGRQTVRRPESAEIERTVTAFPVFVRLGLPCAEARFSAPGSIIRSPIEESGNWNESAIRSLDVSLKANGYTLPVLALAAGLSASFPRLNPDQYLYGESLQLYPFLAMDVMSPPDAYAIHLHAGYRFTFPYQRRSLQADGRAAGPEFSFNPGDLFFGAAGVEVPVIREVWILGEFSISRYGRSRVDGNAVQDSDGWTLSAVPGIRFESGGFKAKLGVEVPLEARSSRPLFESRYLWRILAAASLRFPFA